MQSVEADMASATSTLTGGEHHEESAHAAHDPGRGLCPGSVRQRLDVGLGAAVLGEGLRVEDTRPPAPTPTRSSNALRPNHDHDSTESGPAVSYLLETEQVRDRFTFVDLYFFQNLWYKPKIIK